MVVAVPGHAAPLLRQIYRPPLLSPLVPADLAERLARLVQPEATAVLVVIVHLAPTSPFMVAAAERVAPPVVRRLVAAVVVEQLLPVPQR